MTINIKYSIPVGVKDVFIINKLVQTIKIFLIEY